MPTGIYAINNIPSDTASTTLQDTTPIVSEENLYLPVAGPSDPPPDTAYLLGRRTLPLAQLLRHPQVDLSLRLFLSNHAGRGANFDSNNPRTQGDIADLVASFLRALEDVEADAICRAALAARGIRQSSVESEGEDGEKEGEESIAGGRGSAALSGEQVS